MKYLVIIFSSFILSSIISCNQNKNVEQQNEVVTSDSTQSATKLLGMEEISKKSNEEICLEEKFVIKENLDEIPKYVKKVKNEFTNRNGDDIEWGKFIRDFNLAVQNLREQKNNQVFSCVNSTYYLLVYDELVLLGNSYAFENAEDMKFYEKRIKEYSSKVLNEIQITKKDELARKRYLELEKNKFGNYKIVETKKDKYKCVATTMIQHKLDKNILSELSNKIKNEHSNQCDRIHIFYLLPEMKNGNGAWARVDFNPYEKIEILGLSIEDEEYIKNNLDNITDYIGLWIDNQKKGNIIQRIRKDKKSLVLEYVSTNETGPSDFAHPLKKANKNGKTIYKVLDSDFGEYYVIEKNGDLSAYDNEGYILTQKKLKLRNF